MAMSNASAPPPASAVAPLPGLGFAEASLSRRWSAPPLGAQPPAAATMAPPPPSSFGPDSFEPPTVPARGSAATGREVPAGPAPPIAVPPEFALVDESFLAPLPPPIPAPGGAPRVIRPDTDRLVMPPPPAPGAADDWFASSAACAPAPPVPGAGASPFGSAPPAPPPRPSPAPLRQPEPPPLGGFQIEETARRKNVRAAGPMAHAFATPEQAERPDCVGQIGQIQLAELVRFMYLGKKSGIIDASHEDYRGEIAFSGGEIAKVATYLDDREVNKSLVALRTMCGWKRGRFKIVFCEIQVTGALVKTTAAWLAEVFGSTGREI
jgi:hypothetical protein